MSRHPPVSDAEILERIKGRCTVSPGGCWEWQGTLGRWGYGQVSVRGRQSVAHRVTYEILVGPIPEGLRVCHSCDNPKCCNVAHLWLGTDSDNIQDARRKGRHALAAKTHCLRGHAFAEYGYLRRDGRRVCSECKRDRYRREKVNGKGPHNAVKTHCKNGHPLSGENLYVVPSDGRRQCRACRLVVTRRGLTRLQSNGDA